MRRFLLLGYPHQAFTSSINLSSLCKKSKNVLEQPPWLAYCFAQAGRRSPVGQELADVKQLLVAAVRLRQRLHALQQPLAPLCACQFQTWYHHPATIYCRHTRPSAARRANQIYIWGGGGSGGVISQSERTTRAERGGQAKQRLQRLLPDRRILPIGHASCSLPTS